MEEMNLGKVQEQVQEKEQTLEKAKKIMKKLRINKQIVTSFLAGMGAMLIIVVGIATAVQPSFLTGILSSANSLEGLNFDESTGTITGYIGSQSSLVIPNTINGKEVKEIGNIKSQCI